MKITALSLFLGLITLLPVAQAQGLLQDDKTLSEQVRGFFKENGENFSQFNPSCPTEDDCTKEQGYHYTQREYRYLGNAEEAFLRFASQSPDNAWNGKSFFEAGWDPESGEVYTRATPSGVKTVALGQIFVLKLSITKKMVIPVAFKVVKIDHENNTFMFSYLDNNKSKGYQKVTFRQKGKHIQVDHITLFKSDSGFRDALLYEPFHNMLLDNFYKGIQSQVFNEDF